MLSKKETDYVRGKFLTDITDSDKRSKILFVADALASEIDKDDNYYDVYWSIVGYFLDPKNDQDLEKDFKDLGGSLTIAPFDTPYEEYPPGMLDQPDHVFKFPK
jgi:hypothetical protein